MSLHNTPIQMHTVIAVQNLIGKISETVAL
jgi:hypothetical protein